MVAFRRDLFLLKDLNQHRDAIQKSDLVLISAGINEIVKNGAEALTLHNHLRHFTSQFTSTQFLFDSVSPVNLNADRFNNLNGCINQLNELLFKMSLRTNNFKLFDNLSFGLSHLSRDGLHFNQAGKTVLSNCWVNCVLIRLGVKRGSLPIRRHFELLFHNFNLELG